MAIIAENQTDATGRKALIVAGMHRSGTSATAGALGLLGATLPKDLLAPMPGVNDVGFFEPSRIVVVHEEMLASAGSSWHDVSPLPETWFRSPAARAFAQRLKATYLEEYGDAPLTVLKDPRVCRFLPLWQEILASLGVTPVIVIPFRHPVEVAASLTHRDGFASRKSQILWLEHLLLAEYSSRGFSRAFVSYEELLADPRGTLTRLANDLALEWPSPIDQSFPELKPFLSRRHHHMRAFAPGGVETADIAPVAQRLYSTLEDIVGAPTETQTAALDDLRSSYLSADQLHGPLIRTMEIGLARALQQGESAKAEISRSLADRESRIAELLEEARSRGAEWERQIREAQGVTSERDAHIQELTRALSERDTEIKDLKEIVRKLSETVAQSSQELIQSRQLADERAAQVDHAQHVIADRDRALLTANAEITRGASEAAVVSNHVRELEARVRGAETTIADIRASTSWKVTYPLRALKRLFGE